MAIVTLHVSVWVEILECDLSDFEKLVTLHVSVWVEIVRLPSLSAYTA